MTPTSTDSITTPLPDPNATIPGTTVPNVAAMPTSVVPTVPTMPIPTNPQPGLQPLQPQLETQQAQLVLNQNLDEGRYSVAELQRRLRDEGLYSGEISGMMTAETQAAIVAAQRKHGLSPSDLLDTASN
jgi:hypothetical protein